MRNLRVLLIIFSITLLFYGCEEKSNPAAADVSQYRPANPYPPDGAVRIDNLVTLAWEAEDADSFMVLFDRVNPPVKVVKPVVEENKLSVFAAGSSTPYYWQVVSLLPGGYSVAGDVWSFTTKDNTPDPGFIIKKHLMFTVPPNKVKILFQVVDLNNGGITNLSTGDFIIYEDGESIPDYESNVAIAGSPNNFKLKTLLMLDNSTSLTGGPDNLPTIKNAAVSYVNSMFSQEEIAVYKFSSAIDLVLDFTPVTGQGNIINAVNSLNYGAPSTNLYGAVIKGASELTEIYTEDIIEQSVMIIFTDGDDTQGSRSLDDAVNAVYGKYVYTVGIGQAINPYVLSLIGNRGYYFIDDSSVLDSVFNKIETDIANLANSFYWLEYSSPKRGNVEHSIHLYIKNNPANTHLEGTFSSAGFFDPVPGIYFSSSFINPQGIDTYYLKTDGTAVSINVTTYGNTTGTASTYSWGTNPSVNINFVKSDGSLVEVNASSAASVGQTITMAVKDNITGFSRDINFVIY
ncbi:MAG: VWA domain-containing protein [Melioribacteraceae bacterium]|nr:VWA domain-containing protein [Melioribacteraceae bacterium]